MAFSSPDGWSISGASKCLDVFIRHISEFGFKHIKITSLIYLFRSKHICPILLTTYGHSAPGIEQAITLMQFANHFTLRTWVSTQGKKPITGFEDDEAIWLVSRVRCRCCHQQRSDTG